ncbi:MAG: hypothetical protein LBH07_01620, partial [Treponema sp.]|nr:hypothetical protein [Treponema sp.]
MGWSRDKKLYEKTAEFLTKRNIDFYLWFPVFSETGALKGLSPLVDFEGRQIINRGKHEEEDFSFCCPNSSENIEKILEIFEREFASIKFNGIFLDKIRYPSFANGNGQRTVFSCFCPHCRETYEKEQLDVELLKKALVCPTGLGGPSLLSGQTPMGISSYRGCGEYVFDNPVLSRFFEIKACIIFKSLERICRYFRDRNYGIGLDVFAPFLSPFVGQDLDAFSGLCDFIKPMMYRATVAPAGLPFETDALR